MKILDVLFIEEENVHLIKTDDEEEEYFLSDSEFNFLNKLGSKGHVLENQLSC